MSARTVMIIVTALILVAAVIVGISGITPVNASQSNMPSANKLALENVRDYAPALTAAPEGAHWAVDGGELYSGYPRDWQRMPVPAGVIVGAVALDADSPQTVYIGAANDLALYRSTDASLNWERIGLTDEHIGGVTDLAVDGHHNLIYVATDTAGIFRLRDVGSGVIAGGHTMIHEPVIEVATDSTGASLAFARTANNLYRAENGGLSWSRVASLTSAPTALAVTGSLPPAVYVGTVDRGLLKSADGIAWMSANDGLGLVPGSRLMVDALTVDPQQPEVMYVATSYLYGSTSLHQSPAGVAMSMDGGRLWNKLADAGEAPVAELLPLSGSTGAVYALTTQSRAPLALGSAPAAPALAAAQGDSQGAGSQAGSFLAWIVAMVAAIWLTILVATDMRRLRPAQPAVQTVRVEGGGD